MPHHPSLRDRAEMLTPPMPWDRPKLVRRDGPTVVLLHGLWRGLHAMEPLARELRNDGFSTLNIPYPSMLQPIPRLASSISELIASTVGNSPVHLVTHSLGGILARAMLAQDPSWSARRIVMLCPPNRGSEIVDWSRKIPPLRAMLGPAGRSLGTHGAPLELPPIPTDVETAVIMGNHGTIPFFRKLLAPENDGIVSVSSGRLNGLRGFSVIPADHTFIQMHPDAIRLTTRFLKTGEWPA
nr:alpha/beta fold hydrolase [Verrucomicrobiota bacterium JB025]